MNKYIHRPIGEKGDSSSIEAPLAYATERKSKTMSLVEKRCNLRIDKFYISFHKI